MGILKKYISKLDRVSDNLEKVAMKAILDNKAFVLSTLKNDQLGEGLDSFGRLVGEYAESTQEWAKQKPKARTAKDYGSNYNFEWTGRFFDTMKIKKANGGYDIDSARKAELESIYKTKLTAFTKENSDFVNDKVVTPALYDSIFKALT